MSGNLQNLLSYTKAFSKYLIIGGVFILFFSNNGLYYLLLIRNLQLIAHLPILLVPFPVLTILFIDSLMVVLKFDVMEYLWLWN